MFYISTPAQNCAPLLHVVEHVQVAGVCVAGNQGVARWQGGEPQVHEGTHQQSSIIAILLETHNDPGALQNFLSILHQGDKSLLGAFGDQACWHLHIQTVLPQNGFPGHLNVLREAEIKGKTERLMPLRGFQ